jgi:rhamnosyltransferase
MKVIVFCPLYNAEKYLPDLISSINEQVLNEKLSLFFILTESSDGTKSYLETNSLPYMFVKKEDFSHSLSREIAISNSDADIAIMITQDVVIQDKNAFSKLIEPIVQKKAVFSYGRQISDSKSIEKYTREYNYPLENSITTSKDIPSKGLKTFFASDAFAAYDVAFFKSCGGYDHKIMFFSEDMYYAHKVIMSGNAVAYQADAIVHHSHNFTLKELKHRYYMNGKFFKENPEMQKYSANKAGMGLAIYCLKRAFQERNLPVLLTFVPNMIVRYIGKKKGERSK